MTKIDNRFDSKNSVLITTLSEVFGEKMNLARIKFFGLFISALCKVQTGCFEKLATSFDTDVRVDPSLRRILTEFPRPVSSCISYFLPDLLVNLYARECFINRIYLGGCSWRQTESNRRPLDCQRR